MLWNKCVALNQSDLRIQKCCDINTLLFTYGSDIRWFIGDWVIWLFMQSYHGIFGLAQKILLESGK